MSYDQDLAKRVRKTLGGLAGLTEKEMFGGIGFMVNGNMACGVIGENLIVRVGKEAYTDARTRPHTQDFDFTGKAMTGWIVVAPNGVAKSKDLKTWVQRGLAFALTLPPKEEAEE